MGQPLVNISFLITRPAHQSAKLSAQIAALGGHCLLFPTIDIKFLPKSEDLIAFQHQTSGIDKIIFVSSNAVLAVMPHWPNHANSAEIFALGSGTAATLASFKIAAKLPQNKAFNSEGLLDLPQLQAVSQQTIVICKGVGGRQLLTEVLRARGARVKELSVYQRSCPAIEMTSILKQWQQSHFDFIISTSCESLENLSTLLGHQGQAWLHEQQLLVISPSMQILAKKLGFKPPAILAENASDEAILNAALLAAQNIKHLPQTKQEQQNETE